MTQRHLLTITDTSSANDTLIVAASETALPVRALTPDEIYAAALAKIKQKIISHAWDGGAMFFGTDAYMGIYFTQPYFERSFGSNGGYAMHNIAMGVGANLVATPFVRQGRLAEDMSRDEANSAAWRYLVLCSVLDVLYQPVQDLLTAYCLSDSITTIEFLQYADATFSTEEVSIGLLLFGFSFGLLYYLIEKCLMSHDDEEELAVELFDDSQYRFYQRAVEWLSTPLFTSAKSGNQYFVFYISDAIFNLVLADALYTTMQVSGCGMWMTGYAFVFDCLPELFEFLEVRRAYTLRCQALHDATAESTAPLLVASSPTMSPVSPTSSGSDLSNRSSLGDSEPDDEEQIEGLIVSTRNDGLSAPLLGGAGPVKKHYEQYMGAASLLDKFRRFTHSITTNIVAPVATAAESSQRNTSRPG